MVSDWYVMLVHQNFKLVIIIFQEFLMVEEMTHTLIMARTISQRQKKQQMNKGKPRNENLETDQEKIILAQKYTTDKKSIILIRFG